MRKAFTFAKVTSQLRSYESYVLLGSRPLIVLLSLVLLARFLLFLIKHETFEFKTAHSRVF